MYILILTKYSSLKKKRIFYVHLLTTQLILKLSIINLLRYHTFYFNKLLVKLIGLSVPLKLIHVYTNNSNLLN
jgi:hypothetical protein